MGREAMNPGNPALEFVLLATVAMLWFSQILVIFYN